MQRLQHFFPIWYLLINQIWMAISIYFHTLFYWKIFRIDKINHQAFFVLAKIYKYLQKYKKSLMINLIDSKYFSIENIWKCIETVIQTKSFNTRQIIKLIYNSGKPNQPPCAKPGKVHIIEGAILYFGLVVCGALTGLTLLAYEKFHHETPIDGYITAKGQLVNFDSLVSNGQLEFMLSKKLASVVGNHTEQ